MDAPESLLAALSMAIPAMRWEVKREGMIEDAASFCCYGDGKDIMVQCAVDRPGKRKFSGFISTARKFVPAIKSVIQTTEDGNSEAPYYVIAFNDGDVEFTSETVRLLSEGKVDSTGKFLY